MTNLSKLTDEWENEGDVAGAERQELTAADRAELNQLIDEQREQERLADEAYWERMCELEEERRRDL